MDIGSIVLQIINTFSSFVVYFFQPIDNSVVQSLFGDVSLFTIIFGGGLLVFVVYQLVKWIKNIIA